MLKSGFQSDAEVLCCGGSDNPSFVVVVVGSSLLLRCSMLSLEMCIYPCAYIYRRDG